MTRYKVEADTTYKLPTHSTALMTILLPTVVLSLQTSGSGRISTKKSKMTWMMPNELHSPVRLTQLPPNDLLNNDHDFWTGWQALIREIKAAIHQAPISPIVMMHMRRKGRDMPNMRM